MNKKMHDEFLQPLRDRPDLNADQRFKQELKQKLNSMATKNSNDKRTWLPNLLTAVLLFIGMFAGYQVIFKGESTIVPRNGEQVKNNETPVVLTEQMAKETVSEAFTHVLAVYNGGGEQPHEFHYNGTKYRYMADNFNTKKKIVDYLKEEYTNELANRIFGVLDIIKYEEKLAQPIKDSSTNLLWHDAQIASRKQINDTTWTMKFQVAVDHKGSPVYRSYNLEFKYENGWKLNGALPFTSHLMADELADQGEGKQSSGYKLTEEDLNNYQAFATDLNENRLKGLDPRVIAWFYVNAQGEQRYDVAYALYTDRNGYVQWTKEEEEKIPANDRPLQEQLADTYTGLLEGKFIKTGPFKGYIEFTNPEGKQGFQMVKDEDGIWNVAFIPMQ
ncbi:DL-endopeptidase inhibitor IseA family protein [Neobacillus sp. SuZ13]|uniref:DL-endopeptidase inhibitor IseA family protein n=1 Tax=Neobacillus sp. SuZ13 TaxID=3047875 RepID=UPI0024C0BCDC|nr:DL-endopeptidase inhibitor IseA family protein [Neobacillus sp. SuZ13]WHY67777.1 DL-endopeptidase inhibitor IseA family protein [Neobacillus sp. SuZ13]